MAVVFGSMEWYEQVKELANKDEGFKKGTADWEGAVRTVVIMDEEVLKDYAKEENVKGFLSMAYMMKYMAAMNALTMLYSQIELV